MSEIRTRFAPSPTGFMHVGNVRTALFAWLFARSQQGTFILRIEDTDQNRSVEGSYEHILECLDWLGIDRDEGPVAGGEFGPYIQSERLDVYREYAQRLIDSGRAYADPFKPEDVEKFRQQAKEQKKPFLFREYRPDETPTPKDWHKKTSIRFKTENPTRTTWQDIVRGELSAGEEALDDFVLIKADGYPTYNFAHVIDDQLMQITHVVRGEEFIPSVPKFLALMDALDFKHPEFITVPPILNANGGKKLSKRDGAKDLLEYRTDGYSAEAVANFLASLGWNDGTEKEVFTRDELVSAFDASRIQRSGAKFDETKLDWLQWQHDLLSLESHPEDFLSSLGFTKHSSEFASLAASKARNKEDFVLQYEIYEKPQSINLAEFDLAQVDSDLTGELAEQYLLATIDTLMTTEDFNASSIEEVLRTEMSALKATPRAYLNLVRWAITNRKVSPNLFEMIQLLGKQETIDRLQKSLR